jgi:hypothetical protein
MKSEDMYDRRYSIETSEFPDGKVEWIHVRGMLVEKLLNAEAKILELSPLADAWEKFVSLQSGDVKLLCDVAVENERLKVLLNVKEEALGKVITYAINNTQHE